MGDWEGEGILKTCWQDWQRADLPAAESGTPTVVWQDGHFVRIGMQRLIKQADRPRSMHICDATPNHGRKNRINRGHKFRYSVFVLEFQFALENSSETTSQNTSHGEFASNRPSDT